MPSLFKDGPQLLNQGIDQARRRYFVQAGSTFADAARKFQKSGDAAGASTALAYSQLMFCSPGAATGTNLRSLAELLDSLGPLPLQPGARAIHANQLARQLRVQAFELDLKVAADSRSISHSELASNYQALAQKYGELGDEPLFLEELFEGRSVPGSSRVAVYSALAEESLGASIEATNPTEAAQHYQSAHLWWQQAGESARAGRVSTQVALLSTRARCWFCGREGAGLGVQLVNLPVDVPVQGLVQPQPGPLPSVDASGRQLYACAGCYSSVKLLADSIALQRDAELATRMQAQIDDLKRQVASIRHT